MPPTIFHTPETLTRHEPFVRALARALLRDPGRADDVVQDTWLTALRRPPAAGVALKGWLASVVRSRAHDVQRSDRRATLREERAARPEAQAGVDAIHARLSLQREVVDAVLALSEPYRSVVLLRYWKGLSPTQIGRELERSAATVRSQLSRGHALLRARLDDEEHGAPHWSALALPVPGVSLFTLAAVACGLLSVPLAFWLASRPAFDRAPRDATSAALVVPQDRDDQDRDDRPRTGARPRGMPGEKQLDALTPHELLPLFVQARRALEEIVFSPRLEDLQAYPLLVERSDVRMTRLLTRSAAERYEGYFHSDAAAAYGGQFSFATASHDYDREPDVALDGDLRASSSVGFLHDLGELALTDVPGAADAPPADWSDAEKERWAFLWEEYDADALQDRSVRERGDALFARRSRPSVGHTYVVRTAYRRDHDQLAAFQVLGRQPDGVTIAWRVLRSWMPSQDRSPVPYADVPAAPAWMDALGHDELVAFMDDLRVRAEVKLFAVGPALAATDTAQAYLALAGPAERAGVTKLLPRGKWNPLVRARLGGAYWSCANRSHSYNDAPDIGLKGTTHYGSGFAGNDEGWFLDLGELSRTDLALALHREAPEDLTPEQVAAWDLLLTTQPTVERRRKSLDSEGRRLAKEAGLADRVLARIGHTYLLRTLLYDDRDHVIVFTVLDAGDEGHTLAWRLLEER